MNWAKETSMQAEVCQTRSSQLQGEKREVFQRETLGHVLLERSGCLGGRRDSRHVPAVLQQETVPVTRYELSSSQDLCPDSSYSVKDFHLQL